RPHQQHHAVGRGRPPRQVDHRHRRRRAHSRLVEVSGSRVPHGLVRRGGETWECCSGAPGLDFETWDCRRRIVAASMANPRNYKVGLIQMSMGPDPEANFSAALNRIRQAATQGANIVCLPELFRAQYFCQREDLRLFDLAEPIPGPSTEKLAEVARESGIAIVASLFERRAAGLYHNTAVTLNSDGAVAGIYRKMHIPDDPLYYEKYYFTPGDLGFHSTNTSFGRIGTLVCWDQWYPEGARLTALQGAEVLFYPTAIGWHPAEKAEYGTAQYDAWQTIQRAHAIA